MTVTFTNVCGKWSKGETLLPQAVPTITLTFKSYQEVGVETNPNTGEVLQGLLLIDANDEVLPQEIFLTPNQMLDFKAKFNAPNTNGSFSIN